MDLKAQAENRISLNPDLRPLDLTKPIVCFYSALYDDGICNKFKANIQTPDRLEKSIAPRVELEKDLMNKHENYFKSNPSR